MTVRYVKELQHSLKRTTPDSNLHFRYKTGYIECAREVNRYLNSSQSIDESVRNRLRNHLTRSIRIIEAIQPDTKPESRLGSPDNNSVENAIQKTEGMEQELPAPVASPISSATLNPVTALQINVPNSMTLSGISIPELTSSNGTPLNSNAQCNNNIHSDYSTGIEYLKPRSTLVTTPNFENTQNPSAANEPIKTSPHNGQYFHQPKQILSQSNLTSVPVTFPAKITTPSPTRSMDESSSPITKPLLVNLPSTQVTGSFQIIPGSIYNGQPVALYLAPTTALPTAPEYIKSSVANMLPPATTVSSTINSDVLSMQIPQIITAAVPQSTLSSHFHPQTTAPDPTSLFRSAYGQPLQGSYPQRIETQNSTPVFHSNHVHSLQRDSRLWRPWWGPFSEN